MNDSPNRTLSVFDSIALMVGIIVGAGIFETTAVVAANASSAFVVITLWVVGGILSLAGALCYGELARAMPDDGGDATYYTRAFGKKLGFLFAWARFSVIQPGSIAALSFTVARYLHALGNFSFQSGSFSAIAVAVMTVLILTGLNIASVIWAARIQNGLTVLKVLAIGILVLCSVLVPLAPSLSQPTPFQSNWGLAMVLILFTYGGWNEIAYVAGELKAPWRVNFSLVVAVLICTVLYTGVNLALLATLGHRGLVTSAAPVTELLKHVFSARSDAIFSTMVVLCTIGAVHGLIFTGGRVVSVLSDYNPVFGAFGKWDNEKGTPVAALLAQATLSIAIIIFTGSFSASLIYTATVTWGFFALTGVSLLLLRRKEPTIFLKRLGIIPWSCALILIVSSVWLTWSSATYDPVGTIVSLVIVLGGFFTFGRNTIPKDTEIKPISSSQ